MAYSSASGYSMYLGALCIRIHSPIGPGSGSKLKDSKVLCTARPQRAASPIRKYDTFPREVGSLVLVQVAGEAFLAERVVQRLQKVVGSWSPPPPPPTPKRGALVAGGGGGEKLEGRETDQMKAAPHLLLSKAREGEKPRGRETKLDQMKASRLLSFY
eukprot:scaffold78790_cov29-Tisochrysis_lutea.AAC.4